MTYTKKVVKGVLWVMTSSFLAAIFAYLVKLLIARNLSQENFGLTYGIVALFGLISIFAHFGLNETLSKYISEFRIKKQFSNIKFSIVFAFLTQLAVNAIATAIIFFSAHYLAIHYFKNPAAELIIKLFAITFFLAPFEFIVIAAFQGFQRIKLYSFATLMRPVFLFFATLILFFLGYNILSYPFAMIGVFALTFFVYIPIFFRNVFPEFSKIKLQFKKNLSKKLILFAIPVVISSSAFVVLSYTDTLMITYFKTLQDVAYYNVAVPTAQVLGLISTSVATVLLPISSEIWTKNKDLLIDAAKKIYKFASIIILPASFALFSFSDFVIITLFGAEYAPASSALKILSIGGIFLTLGQINITFLYGTGKPRYNSIIVWVAAIINLCLNFYMVPRFGINGAAFSTAFSFGLMLLLSQLTVKRLMGIAEDLPAILKTIGCAIVFIASIYLLKNTLNISALPKIIISLLLASVIYVTLLLATKTISLAELRDIWRATFIQKRSAVYMPPEQE